MVKFSRFYFSEKFPFLVTKFSICLNSRVFVMGLRLDIHGRCSAVSNKEDISSFLTGNEFFPLKFYTFSEGMPGTTLNGKNSLQ